MENLIKLISNVKSWLRQTRKKAVKFIVALLMAYILFFFAIIYQWPIEIIFTSMLLTLIIPFGLIVMLTTSNQLYKKLSSSHWGKAVIAVVIAIYFAFSSVWAAGEVNRIFSEAPGNFPFTISMLTGIYFFKNIVLAFTSLLILAIMIYSTYWVLDVLVINYKSLSILLRRVLYGVLFVFSVGLISGTAGFVTAKADEFTILVALNADFSSKHRCTGEIFNGAQGVLFLTSGNVLVAKPPKSGGKQSWDFPKEKCEI